MLSFLLGFTMFMQSMFTVESWSPDKTYSRGSVVKYNKLCFRSFSENVIGKPPVDKNSVLDDSIWALYIKYDGGPCSSEVQVISKGKHHVHHRKSRKKSH